MTTDEDTFMDVLQDVIDDLKNKPSQTAVMALIIKNDKNVVFKHVPDHLDEEFAKRFIKTAL